MYQLIALPNEIFAQINQTEFPLTSHNHQSWQHNGARVELKNTGNSILVEVASAELPLKKVTLVWNYPAKAGAKYCGDHWERSYGDLAWKALDPERPMPWYFLELYGKITNGFGVKTGCNAMCYWQIDTGKLKLILDTRSGSKGVHLGDRVLQAAEIVIHKEEEGESPFKAAQKLCQKMCESPRLPEQPVYGINDWYFAYGQNSAELILEHCALLADLAAGNSNRPFSVVDAGWAITADGLDESCWSDDFSISNSKFGDMALLAEKIKAFGMRPGIWVRPLCASHKDADWLLLPGKERILDPTIPQNMERVKNYFSLYRDWGYELVKFDFTAFDMFGKWGYQMGADVMSPEKRFNDKSKTNAEITLDLYRAIREAARDTTIIACNTFSHLSAGLFELCRVGDDTSGLEWARTKKMGVNSLGFRIAQHNHFYSADGDCVGLTPKVPWELNKQWMQLLAVSGTPLFISAQAEAVGSEQKAFIRQCFKNASTNLTTGEPLDWVDNLFPEKWRLNGREITFYWD